MKLTSIDIQMIIIVIGSFVVGVLIFKRSEKAQERTKNKKS